MKNLKIYKIFLLAGITITLVGCKNNEPNKYENKETYQIEITKPLTEIESTKEEETAYIEISTEPITEIPPQQVEIITEAPTQIQIETPTQPQTEPITQLETETQTEDVMTDEEVIEFIQRVGNDMNECSETIFDGAVHGFITVVDFLFYGGTIGGRTFDSLTDEGKTKALALYEQISTYVEANWPIWKEKIGVVYEDAKILWADKKEDLSELLETGKQKIKTWYENLKNKHNYN